MNRVQSIQKIRCVDRPMIAGTTSGLVFLEKDTQTSISVSYSPSVLTFILTVSFPEIVHTHIYLTESMLWPTKT
jgi:hypothetical protein